MALIITVWFTYELEQQIWRGFKVHDLITFESKVAVSPIPQGVSEF